MTARQPPSALSGPKPTSKNALSAEEVHGFFKEHQDKSLERKRKIPDVRGCEELACLANRLRAEWEAILRHGKVFEVAAHDKSQPSRWVFSKEELEHRIVDVRKAAINLQAAMKGYIDHMARSLEALAVEEAQPSSPLPPGFGPYVGRDTDKERAASWAFALENSLEETKEFAGCLDHYIKAHLPEGNKLATLRWYELGTRGVGLSPVEKIQDACVEALKAAGVKKVSRNEDTGPVAHVTARVLGWVCNDEIHPASIRAHRRKSG